jgi:hypothetical protein
MWVAGRMIEDRAGVSRIILRGCVDSLQEKRYDE